MDIKEIAKEIEPICYFCDTKIYKASPRISKPWAVINSCRHARNIQSIIDYAARRKTKKLRVLNASGLGCGHQDFSILSYLKKRDYAVEWVVYDSPNSEYLRNKHMKDYIKKLDIQLVETDFSKAGSIFGERANEFDIVLFGEIAEHLDHSVFLKTLLEIKHKVKPGGIVIVTTPNQISLLNRVRFLFGRTNSFYFDDGVKHMAAGIYGHITLFDLNRLTRLLKDAGFKINKAYAFSDNADSVGKPLLFRILGMVLSFFSCLIRNSEATLFVEATK
ncbi:MAG: methyltransferase domain-containing protein [Candidatus Woesearchaeota archaeon]